MSAGGRTRIGYHLAWAALPLAACGAVATGSDMEGVRGDLNLLRRQMLEVKASSDGNRQFFDQRIAKLEGRVDEEGPRGRAELTARLQEMSTELRLVQGKLEENAHAVSEANRRAEEVSQRLASLNTRILAVEGQMRAIQQAARLQGPGAATAPPAAVPPPTGAPMPPASVPPPPPPANPADRLPPSPPFAGQSGQPPAPPATTAPPPAAPGPVATAPQTPPPVDSRFVGQSADVIYSAALTDYTKQNYDLAIRGFQAFMAQYPRDSRVPDAQWWLADSYYAEQNYPQAIKEYDVVVRNFPDSPKAPAAMFKQGLAYLQGNDATGCRILRDVVAKYARTREAGRAREELRQPLCR